MARTNPVPNPRALTDRERVVLAHTVMDPDEWWAHACGWRGNDPAGADGSGNPIIRCEKSLDAKVAKWGPRYDAALAAGDYKNRAAREVELQVLMGG